MNEVMAAHWLILCEIFRFVIIFTSSAVAAVEGIRTPTHTPRHIRLKKGSQKRGKALTQPQGTLLLRICDWRSCGE
jgi:hypothetical protein